MATFRTIKESGDFVTVHKSFVFDNNLSAKAKGILLYFLSRPDNWQIYTSEVVKHMNDGQKSINSGIQELIELGYVIRTRKRKENGDFNGFEYLVYEQPKQIGEMPFGENVKRENAKRINAKRENAKGRTTNNNRTNNDLTNINGTNNDGNILSCSPTVSQIPYKEIIDYLNQKTGKQYRHTTAKSKRVIEARWNEDFRLDDFKRVIDNKTNDWLNTDSDKYLRPETLFGSKFEGYLNQKPKSTGMDQLERMKYDESYWD